MTEELVFVYNRGKRTWDIPIEWEEELPKAFVRIGPSESKELPEKVAKRYVERYGRELMFGQGDVQRKVDPRIAELEDENRQLRERIAELESGGSDDTPTEKDLLILKAQRMGIDFDKRIGVEKLKKLIEEASGENDE